MKKLGKIAKLITATVLGAALLAGCGNSVAGTASTGASSTENQTTAESGSNAESGANADTKTVTVSVDGATAPFNYQDENGNLVGYEVDLLNEIAARSDGKLQFNFNVTNWDGIFASLDSGKADMIVNNITKKPEREEKYLFSDYSYYNNHTVIVVPKGDTSITSIDDLQGKSIEALSGTAVALFLEDYNEQHADNPITLLFSDASTATMISNVATGRYPAYICSESYVNEAVKQLGLEVDTIAIPNEDEIQSSQAWFLYGANEADLKAEVDPILKEIIDDGTLSTLSEKWYGADYTK